MLEGENPMESIWSKLHTISSRPPLKGEIGAQVAVIGAGMAGILIAAALEEAGRHTVVLEAGRIAGGQTGRTTAKITSQHGLLYRQLTDTLGPDKARQYAQANQRAVRSYADLVERRKIDCSFQTQDAYLYGDDPEQLREEAQAAAALGLPAQFVQEVALPFPTAGAVRFTGQAQFDPLAFLQAVSAPLTIFEHSRVQAVEGTDVYTADGVVRADQVVFACHFPFVDFPGMYFARMHQERSYVLALEGAPIPPGIFLGVGPEGLSLRGFGPYLLLGGQSHRTGENSAGGRYDALRSKARTLFPGSHEVCRWSAQDCITPDHVPYIGRYAAGKPDWYVATGFQKWGMTSSMVAAQVLTDRILGRDSPDAEVFDPGRVDEKTLPGIAGESVQAVKGLTRRFFQIPSSTAKQLPPGHGGVVFLDGEKVGVYKDREGKVYAVDIRCPHLGCQLEWNPDEHSWDCPCHGSRFDCTGRLLTGPAQEGLG